MNILRKRLLATTIVAGSILAPTFALAQSQPAGQPQTQQQNQQQTTSSSSTNSVSEVVVTGSRIRRNEYNSSAPVQILTSEKSALQGLVDTSSVLQQSSLASNSFQVNNQLTGFVTTGGPGAQTISLRGLGSQRTLVLLNGRRVGPAGVGGTVGPIDLNVIPQSQVDRIEILKDGASSIYGSDAVAGVVNIITKTKMDGAAIDVYGNKSFDGGGDKYRISGSWGKTFDRGYISVGADYTEQKALLREDRDDTNCAADYVFDPATHARRDIIDQRTGKPKCFNIQNNMFQVSGNSYQFQAPGFNYFGPSYTTSAGDWPTNPNSTGNLVPTNVVGWGPANGGTIVRTARANYRNTYTYANYDSPYFNKSTVLSPTKLSTLTANGAYDLTSNIQAYGEFLFNRRETEQDSVRQLFPFVAAANPNNPFGTGTARPIIAIPYVFSQKVDYMRGVAGLRGSFGDNLGFLNGWDWDVYGVWSRSDADYYKDEVYNDRVIAVTQGNTGCTTAFGNLSNFNCADLPGGVPWFTPRVLAGNFNQAEKDFLFTRGHNTTMYDQKLVEASMSGDLFTLPAGKVGAAVGVSYRKDEIDDQPDELSRNYNIWGLTSAGPTTGDSNTKEAFAEIEVPVFKSMPFIESLDLQASGRYTHDSSYGGNSTYKVGVNWRITPEWRLRYTQGTSFRAPSLYEQFLGFQTSFQSQGAIDPCINYGANATGTLYNNCDAALHFPGYTGAGSSALIFAGGGAATGNLKPETSEAKTFGIVWTPSFVDLSVAVDYADIEVNDEITRFGAANIVGQCYSKPQPNFYCSLFTRDTSGSPNPADPNFNASYGNITTVFDNYLNIASQRNRSIDLTTRYRHDFGNLGRMTVDTQFTWMLEDGVQLAANGASNDYLGSTFGFRGPDFSGQANLRWDRGDWTAFWNVQMIGKGSDTELFGTDVFNSSRYADKPTGICGPAPANCGAGTWTVRTYFKQYTEFTAYHSLSVRKKFDSWTVTAGIQNVFDERPPSQSSGQFRRGTAAIGNYDMIGRRGFLQISKKF
jgi:iron complex outermembrane receptor protein